MTSVLGKTWQVICCDMADSFKIKITDKLYIYYNA